MKEDVYSRLHRKNKIIHELLKDTVINVDGKFYDMNGLYDSEFSVRKPCEAPFDVLYITSKRYARMICNHCNGTAFYLNAIGYNASQTRGIMDSSHATDVYGKPIPYNSEIICGTCGKNLNRSNLSGNFVEKL